jgi:hypothetical protein
MDRHEILEIIKGNPGFFLATVDEGRPRVRGMLLYRAAERKNGRGQASTSGRLFKN